MFRSIKSLWKWSPIKNHESKKNNSSVLFVIFVNIVEDVLFWKKMWLSLLCFLVFNLIFIACVYRQVNSLQFIIASFILILFIDALESWLKYKHRTSCLKRLVLHDNNKIKSAALRIKAWLEKNQMALIFLRDRNHTKAFLLLQITFSCTLFIGKYTSGYSIIYLLCTVLFFLHKLKPPLLKLLKKVQQNAESDFELEGFVPDESDVNLALLSIEPEQKVVVDDRQSLDYWKPDDLPLGEEASDSSENSSSLVTNLSVEKMQTLTKDIEITDSSEDEYIPQEQSEQFQSTLEVQSSETWSGAAYNVLSNLGGAVANMVYKTQDVQKRRRIASKDSSDGFEMIDTSELQ